MVWRIEFTPDAEKQLAGLGTSEARRIAAFLKERATQNPRAAGDRLKGRLREFWRYRVGHYRILAKILDEQVLVLVVRIGHRSSVYK